MKTNSKFWALILATAMVFSTAFVPVNAAKIKVKKVTVSSSLSGSKKNVIVAKGKSVKLATSVTVTPNKKANKTVSYSIKNKKIATVSSKGVVTGKKTGTTTVTVTSKKDKKKKASITVKVVKGAVKNVTVNKKKASLNVGEKLTLKTTVKAEKGAVKTIAYTSSKPKVAKVNNKGVITAVGSGTAKITAKAIDGSGKKAVCTVTVSNPTNLAGMDIPNARTVSFSLDKPLALQPEQIMVAKKIFVSGTYNNQLIINNISTADNINYTAVLSNDNSIRVGDFVQVTVPTLTGATKSLEMEYKEQLCAFTDEVISKWTVGAYHSDSFSFDEGNGYSSYSLSGVPAGLTYEIKNDYVKVKGTPTTPGAFDFVLSATDELGNTLSKTIHFIVGSDSVIAGASRANYNIIGAETVYQSIYLNNYFTGGSGSYTYSVIADPQGAGATIGTNDYDDDYYYGSGYLTMKAAVAGTYNITVRATDSNSNTCDIIVVWNVKQGISVGGCLKDAQGNPMAEGDIRFTNKDRAAKYTPYGYGYPNLETSTYSAILEPGTYDICAQYNSDGDLECAKSTTYLYAQSLTVSQTGYDIQFGDLYKVALVSNESTGNYFGSWYIDNQNVGYGSTLYLKAGNYTIDSGSNPTSETSGTPDWFNGWTRTTTKTKLSATFAIVNAAVQATVSKVAVGAPETTDIPGAKNTTNTITSISGEYDLSNSIYHAYKFTPSETAKYKTNNSNVRFYDMSGNLVTGNSLNGYSLAKDTTYIVGAGSYYNDDYYSYSFSISKVEDETETPTE